jgi:signal transduction histidine kinase
LITVVPEDGAWLIAVSDQGPGITPEDRERIFEPFWRSPDAGRVPGTGLGLTICAAVALNHGGSLRVEPGSRGGARFVLRMPQRQLASVG